MTGQTIHPSAQSRTFDASAGGKCDIGARDPLPGSEKRDIEGTDDSSLRPKSHSRPKPGTEASHEANRTNAPNRVNGEARLALEAIGCRSVKRRPKPTLTDQETGSGVKTETAPPVSDSWARHEAEACDAPSVVRNGPKQKERTQSAPQVDFGRAIDQYQSQSAMYSPGVNVRVRVDAILILIRAFKTHGKEGCEVVLERNAGPNSGHGPEGAGKLNANAEFPLLPLRLSRIRPACGATEGNKPTHDDGTAEHFGRRPTPAGTSSAALRKKPHDCHSQGQGTSTTHHLLWQKASEL